MRSTVQAHFAARAGRHPCRRLSEFASRVRQSATNLSRPLSRLIDLGYVRREVPFGESIRSTRPSDRRHLLLGEAKWSDHADADALVAGLARKAQRLPFRHGRPTRYALWLKRRAGAGMEGTPIVTPDRVMSASPGT